MPFQTLYLIRHCKAEGQAPDAKLTGEGRMQAERLAVFLSSFPIDYTVSSPYTRARDTIMPFADKAKLTVHTDSRWSERILSNEPRTDWLACLERTFAEPDLCYPGGESSRCAAERALAALDGLLALGHTAYAVATHGNLMSLLLKHYNEQFGFAEWKSLSNPDVYRLNFSGGRFQKMSRIWNG